MDSVENTAAKAGTEVPKFRFFFTMAIGLGFGTTAITWTLYNNNMIVFLENNFQTRYTWMTSTFLGFLMAWDNIIAIFLQPWIGARSDNTKTRFGKRTPYILVGIPLAAIFFALIPQVKAQSVWILILVILSFNMSMAIYRSPVVALMPDLTPPIHRTKGNGVINLMGGVFAGIALFLGGYLLENVSYEAAFGAMSLIMMVSLVAFLLLIREPKELEKMGTRVEEDKPEVKIFDEFLALFTESDKSKLFILLAIASWFMAWNALEVWINPYLSTEILQQVKGTPEYEQASAEATSAIGLVPIIFVVATLPGGYLGYLYGRKRIIMTGLIIFIAAMVFGTLQTELNMVALSMMIAGAAWGLINVNSIVIVWELSKKNIGAGTGLYYLASSAAAISGPILFGALYDITNNYKQLWYYSIFFLGLAFLCMFKVTSGEAEKMDPLVAIGEID